MSDSRRFILSVLIAAWVLAFVYSFVVFWITPAGGDGHARGWNRVSAYLGWQGIAGMLSVAVWALGRSWPKGGSMRRLTIFPLVLAILHLAAICGVIVWARAT